MSPDLCDIAATAPRGLTIVGCRLSGKSYWAHRIRAALGTTAHLVSMLDVTLRRVAGLEALQQAVDVEVHSAIRRLGGPGAPRTWVVDDGELLAQHASDRTLQHLADAIGRQRLRLVLVRNRFVLEEEGALVSRLAPIEQHLDRHTLEPLTPSAAAALARTNGPAGPSADARATWLARWSGGLPGWLSRLAPHVPPHGHPDLPPLHAAQLLEELSHHLLLDSAEMRRAFGLLSAGAAPPGGLLARRDLRLLGRLAAVGMIRPDFGTAPAGQVFQGRLFSMLAAHFARPSSGPDDDDVEVGLALADWLARAGQLDAFCDVAGVDAGVVEAADALARARAWARANPDAHGLEAILADALGRLGLLIVTGIRDLAMPPRPTLQDLARRVVDEVSP